MTRDGGLDERSDHELVTSPLSLIQPWGQHAKACPGMNTAFFGDFAEL